MSSTPAEPQKNFSAAPHRDNLQTQNFVNNANRNLMVHELKENSSYHPWAELDL